MEYKEPMDLWNRIAKMDKTIDQGFDIDEIGSEQKIKEKSAKGDRKQKEQSKIVSQDRNIKGSFHQQSTAQKEGDRDRNEIARIKSQGLNSCNPSGYRKEEVSQVPEKYEPQQDMEAPPGSPEELICLKEIRKPEDIPDQPPGNADPGFGAWGGDDAQGYGRPNPDPEPVQDPQKEYPGGDVRQNAKKKS
jgi:hypothetical protein